MNSSSFQVKATRAAGASIDTKSTSAKVMPRVPHTSRVLCDECWDFDFVRMALGGIFDCLRVERVPHVSLPLRDVGTLTSYPCGFLR